MRHAKHDTEICANQYQSILAKIEADAKAESDARKALDARKASGAEKPSDAEKLADAETNRHALEKICWYVVLSYAKHLRFEVLLNMNGLE